MLEDGIELPPMADTWSAAKPRSSIPSKLGNYDASSARTAKPYLKRSLRPSNFREV